MTQVSNYSERLDPIFNTYLGQVPADELREAMSYSLLNGGKRLRSQLVYATGIAFHASLENLDLPAAAVEMIHTYSLIHDDLPAMDNSDLRRGQASCHRKFNEALAILAGDGLQTLAFQVLAKHPSSLTPAQRIRMINLLSIASGPYGMVAGQALDMTVMQHSPTTDALLQTYQLKTGALLQACVELAVASADVDTISTQQLQEMQQFGRHIGLAFQIQDDILDIETETARLGKPQGLDAANAKITYPALKGIDTAKQQVAALFDQALTIIAPLGNPAELLRQLIYKMQQRQT